MATAANLFMNSPDEPESDGVPVPFQMLTGRGITESVRRGTSSNRTLVLVPRARVPPTVHDSTLRDDLKQIQVGGELGGLKRRNALMVNGFARRPSPVARRRLARENVEYPPAPARAAEAEARQTAPMVTAAAEAMRSAGVRPTRLRALLYSGGGSVRTDVVGWYVRRNHWAAVGTDGRWYVLVVAPSLRTAGRRPRRAQRRPPNAKDLARHFARLRPLTLRPLAQQLGG